MTNKKFGIIIVDLSLFDFGPKPPCGYIKAKHIRPAYGKGARPVKAHKRITRTREGFRKRKSLNFLRISLHTKTRTAPTRTLKKP